MNTRHFSMVGWLLILLVVFATPLCAQENSSEDQNNYLNVLGSVQGKYVREDSSKAEEYGEVPEGFLIRSFDAGYETKDKKHYLTIRGANVRLNDSMYAAAFGEYGKYKLKIDYTKIPHLFSKAGRTIWTETAPGVWTLPDAIQQTIQDLNPFTPDNPAYFAGQARQKAFISNLITNAHFTPLNLQRNRGNAGFTYSPNLRWKYNVNYFKETRDGYRPFGTAFGFSWTTELPEHIDYDTQQVHAAVEYSNKGKLLTLAYDVSLFGNEVQTMLWDNPLRITDRTYELPFGAYVNGDGPATGRAQLPADNTANTFSVAAATMMGKSRFTGSFAYSLWTDNVALLPFTTNSAIQPIPLPANTFNGKLQNITGNLLYTAPVGGNGSFTARYRLYDQSNKNDRLFFAEFVRFDANAEELGEENPLYAFRSNNANVDLGWKLTQGMNWHVAYDFNRWDRDFRDVQTTNTHALRTSVDWLASDSINARFSYQYSRRRFDRYDTDNPTYLVIPLRRFDEANLNENRLRGEVTWNPGERTSVGVNAAFADDDFVNTVYGLQKVRDYSAGIDYSYAIRPNSSINVWYEFQRFLSDQQGRQSGATPSTNPADDWTANLRDRYHTIGVGFNTALQKKTTWNIDVTYMKADGEADLFSPPGGLPDQAVGLSNADDTDQFTARTSVTYKLSQHAQLVGSYWIDRYLIDDYAEKTIRPDLVSFGSILLNAIQPNYQYHVGWIGFLYSW